MKQEPYESTVHAVGIGDQRVRRRPHGFFRAPHGDEVRKLPPARQVLLHDDKDIRAFATRLPGEAPAAKSQQVVETIF